MQPARPSRERCNRCQRRNRDKAYVTNRCNPAHVSASRVAGFGNSDHVVNTMYGMSTEAAWLPWIAARSGRAAESGQIPPGRFREALPHVRPGEILPKAAFATVAT